MRLFISHSSTDSASVTRLSGALRDMGLRAWATRPDEADLLLVVLSPAAVEARDVQAEWEYAIAQGKPVVIVIVEPCPIPGALQACSRVDFAQDESFRQLARALGVSMPTRPLDGRVLSQFEADLTRLDNTARD